MGSYLSEPITKSDSLNESNDQLNVGSSCMQGWRVTQEDAHNCILNFDQNSAFFAVYDGHGGREVAVYCANKLPDFIMSTEAYKNGNMEKALLDGFLQFDATLASRDVIEEMKKLQGTKEQVTTVSDADSDLEDVTNLRQEAAMPLEQVMRKYSSQLSNQQDTNSNELPALPLRAGSSNVSTSIPCIRVSPPASDLLTTLNSLDVPNVADAGPSDLGEAAKEETKNGECEATAGPIAPRDEPGESDKPVQNGEMAHDETEKQPSTSAGHGESAKENGNSEKKGKALKKTKGVGPDDVMPPPHMRSHVKRRAKSLFTRLLTNNSDSEESEEDENDKTFEGPNDANSSDEESRDINDEDDEDDSANDGDESGDEEEELEEDLEDEEEFDEDNYRFAKEMPEEPGSDSGCTAVVALLRGNELYVANAGDSRCVVCRQGKAIDMSFDHKPEDEIERQRVLKAGGKVTSDGRVNGGLNLSRALGDHAYKQNKQLSDREQMITALPDIKTLTINPNEDSFMVLACDGIWNVMSSQEVVDFIGSQLDECNGDLAKVCESLFKNCLSPNTSGDGTGCDNMTAIIVQFKKNLCKRSVPDTDDAESSSCKRIKVDDICVEDTTKPHAITEDVTL